MTSRRIDKHDVLQAARGRWPEALRALAPELSEAIDAGGREVRCPLPGHNDQNPSFRYDDKGAGRAICSCGSYDGIGLLKKLRGWDFPTTLSQVGGHLGISSNGHPANRDILSQVASLKRVSVESLKAYGADVADRNGKPVVRIPCYNESGQAHSYFDLGIATDKLKKGMFRPGKGSSGLFLPGRVPAAGEQWILCEGPKDAAAYHGLGYLACGLPTDQMAAKYARLFAGTNVIVMPDRTVDAEQKAVQTAGRLHGIAATIRIGTLPLNISGANGDDVRDVLAQQDGEQLVRQAIADAQPWEPGAGDERKRVVVPLDSSLPDPCLMQGRTETANARRLVEMHGKNMRWCSAWKSWLAWDGKRWVEHGEVLVSRWAKSVERFLWQYLAKNAGTTLDRKSTEAIARWARTSGSANHISSIIELAKSEPGIAIEPTELNADHWLLNVANGTLDLRTSELRPHDRTDLITYLSPVKFDPQADCSTWTKFLGEIMGGDRELTGFLRRLAGCSLSGEIREHVLAFCYGTGANGKSVFLEAIGKLTGDYGDSIPVKLLLMTRESSEHEKADLFGRRFIYAVESGEGKRLSEEVVKAITGNDRIKGRRLYQNYFAFNPTHTLWLASNYRPTIRGTDEGIWRRILLIPFEVTIPEPKRDEQLPRKLEAELPGILNWAIAGCREWQESGLMPPEKVRVEVSNYRQEQDIVAQFLDECCEIDGTAETPNSRLNQAFSEWCKQNGQRRIDGRWFGRRLNDMGYRTRKSGSERYRLGISIGT